MKMYLNSEQTAKLIELGFNKPKGLADAEPSSGKGVRPAYSIGELIEMLPISFENDNDDTSWLEIEAGADWGVSYSSFGFIDYGCEREELIDALFDMIVELKVDGVI